MAPIRTLGYEVGDWIEDNLVIPDGEKLGQPYILTPEMWRFLIRYYQLNDNNQLRYYGGQLMRPQKWGKDPFMAALVWAEALGPVRPDGTDANGDPVGKPVPTPWIQCAATSEDQTANTFRPIFTMATDGPLANWPGLDIGLTRINLPTGGQIEPVTAAARSRLGQRLSFATFTETHLMTPASGGTKMAAAMKRNLAGMRGRWVEGTNAYDPGEHSEAQITAEAKAPAVLVDYRPPRNRVDFNDHAAMRAELQYVYGDSSVAAGGWVDEERLLQEMQSEAMAESDGRRFFLNEIVAGSSDFVDPALWASLYSDAELKPRERICIGFDGSRNDDHTVVWISRLSDGMLFRGGWWAPEDVDGEWRVPRDQVDACIRNLFQAYRVSYMYADPFRWQDYLDQWAARYPGKVVEFPTNREQKMGDAIDRFLQATRDRSLAHDGDRVLSDHVRNAVCVNGGRKRDREPGKSEFHLKLAKKTRTHKMDAAVAAVLAYAARGYAVENGGIRERKTRPINFAELYERA